jgi:hypothetical protein
MPVRRETLAWLGRVSCVSDVLSLSMYSADALAPKVTRGRDSRTGLPDMDLTGYGHRRLSCQTHTHTTTTITFHELLDIFHFIIAPLPVSLPLQVSQHQKAQEPGRTHKESPQMPTPMSSTSQLTSTSTAPFHVTRT